MDSPPPISPHSTIQQTRHCPLSIIAKFVALLMAFLIFLGFTASAQPLTGTFSAAKRVAFINNTFKGSFTIQTPDQ